MPFIPHTDDDVREMLAAIGAPSIEALFDEIPANLRVQSLEELPAGLSELEVMQLMAARARADGRALCFIGAGAYEHHIPAAVWSTITRGEFYSAYTPYQAEASQGTLQIDLRVPEHDGEPDRHAGVATHRCTTARPRWRKRCLMAVRANRRSKAARILLPRSLHPHYRAVALATAGQPGPARSTAAVRARWRAHQPRLAARFMTVRTSPRW